MATKSEVLSNTQKGTKVSRKVVELLDELAEFRAMRNQADDKVEELRAEIFAVVGKEVQTLVHHNIEVARITRTEKPRVDTDKLKTDFPEIYELVKVMSESFTIGTVARRKSN